MLTRGVWCAAFCLGFACAIPICPAVADENRGSPPKSTAELQKAIAGILNETNTPGGGVVLVSQDEVLWAAEFGVTDRTGRRSPERCFAGSFKSLVARRSSSLGW
jgi:hypothetical protein